VIRLERTGFMIFMDGRFCPQYYDGPLIVEAIRLVTQR